MRILLAPVGSAGDVHPYVGIGRALQARGHEVAIIANPTFEPLIRRVGLRFVRWGTAEQYDHITQYPALWKQHRSIGVIAEAIRLGSPDMYRLIVQERQRGDLLLVGSGLAFATRVAHETLPLSQLLHHSAAVVHHGGIGTAAQGLAAGRPHVVHADDV